MFAGDPLAADAGAVAALARDVSELMAELGLGAPRARRRCGSPTTPPARCSTASRSATQPKALLKAAGFEVVEPRDSHLCCGSAGTYNLLQPEISAGAPRPQGGDAGGAGAAGDRRRQHRLHDADRRRHRRPGGAYRRAARLGDGRAAAAGARSCAGAA